MRSGSSEQHATARTPAALLACATALGTQRKRDGDLMGPPGSGQSICRPVEPKAPPQGPESCAPDSCSEKGINMSEFISIYKELRQINNESKCLGKGAIVITITITPVTASALTGDSRRSPPQKDPSGTTVQGILCSPRRARLPSLHLRLGNRHTGPQPTPRASGRLVPRGREGQLPLSQWLGRQEGNGAGPGQNWPLTEATGAAL